MGDRTFCFLFAVTFGVATLDTFLLMRSMQAAPTIADVATSHVVPLSDHGVIHYITPLQSTLFFYALFPTVLVILLIGARIFLRDGIEMLSNREKNSNP